MKNNVEISPLKSSWIEEIARIHYSSLPNDFLPSFGYDFLSNIFYPAVLTSSFGKVFVAVRNDDEPIGFVLVTTDSNEFLKELVKNRILNFFIRQFRCFTRPGTFSIIQKTGLMICINLRYS